jgi:hypothetical protein
MSLSHTSAEAFSSFYCVILKEDHGVHPVMRSHQSSQSSCYHAQHWCNARSGWTLHTAQVLVNLQTARLRAVPCTYGVCLLTPLESRTEERLACQTGQCLQKTPGRKGPRRHRHALLQLCHGTREAVSLCPGTPSSSQLPQNIMGLHHTLQVHHGPGNVLCSTIATASFGTVWPPHHRRPGQLESQPQGAAHEMHACFAMYRP